MKKARRYKAGLALAVFAAVSACVVLSVYAQKFADPLAAEVRATYESRLSLHRMTDISALDGLFAEHQILFLPIAPPGLDALVQPANPFVIPFDWQNFPEEFNKRLIGEMKHGAPVYFVRVAEDPKSREIVFYNADDERIYALPPPKDYNPFWFVESWFPGVLSGRFDVQTTDYLLEMYDPARIQLTVNLVPTENLFDYLTGEAQEAAMLQAQAASLAPEGGMFLLDGEGDFAIAQYSRATNGLRMSWTSDTNSYFKVYECHDLMSGVWALTNMTLGAASETAWVLPAPEEDPWYRFYRVVQASVTNSTDEDADGMPDVWELQNGLNPVLANGGQDADTDGLSNFQEYLNGTTPNLYDSNTNGVPDGWDTYGGTVIKGDVNGDGVLSSADLTALDNILAQGAYNVTPVTFSQADLNGDGVLDASDRQGLQDLLDGHPQLFILKPKAS
ncbi:MAG: dockerin type I repeat-containing protein [Kiritimatiellae bacterium]|nr:dockerin type I repeat-containing protein [Kiritimatiellia bacterium]MCO5068460.1 dockerin type I repeat-containing protein [Kiritimatiellia bacterium]